jgi:hypothetical protein
VIWTQHRGQHRPDLGIEVDGVRVAIEVELSHKSPRRLRAILAGHEVAISSGQIGGGLIYVSDRPDVLAAVERAAGRIGMPRERFRTRPLADVRGEVLRRASLTNERGGAAGAHRLTQTAADRATGRGLGVDLEGGTR